MAYPQSPSGASLTPPRPVAPTYDAYDLSDIVASPSPSPTPGASYDAYDLSDIVSTPLNAEALRPIPSHERQTYLSALADAAGARPDPLTGRMPSDFKLPGHPNEVAGGFNTITGARVPNMPRGDFRDLLDVGWDQQAAAQLAATPEPARPAAPMVAQGMTVPGTARVYQPGEPVPPLPVTGPAAVWKPADEAMTELATRKPTATPNPFNPPRFAGLETLRPIASHVAPDPIPTEPQRIMGVPVGSPMAPGLEQALVASEQSPMTLAEARTPGVGPLELPAIRPVAPAPPELPEGRTVTGTMKDLGIVGLKAAIGLPEMVIGLLDIPTLGYVGKALESVGYRPAEAKQILETYYSDPQKRAKLEVSEAKGVLAKATAALSNPSVIAETVIESLPQMAAGGYVGRGVMGVSRLPAWAAGALGEGAVTAGQQAEQIREQSPSGRLTVGQAAQQTAAGLITGSLSLFGGKLASKLGIADAETLLVGGAATAASRRGLTKSLVYGAAQEGFLEELPQSVQEQVWQNASLGRPLDEGVDEAAVLGAFAGVVMGGGAQAVARAMPGSESPVPPPVGGPEPVPMVGREQHVPPAGRQQQPPRGTTAAPPSPPPPAPPPAVAPPAPARPGPPAAEPPTAKAETPSTVVVEGTDLVQLQPYEKWKAELVQAGEDPEAIDLARKAADYFGVNIRVSDDLHDFDMYMEATYGQKYIDVADALVAGEPLPAKVPGERIEVEPEEEPTAPEEPIAPAPAPRAQAPLSALASAPTADEKAAAKAEMKRRMQEAGLLPKDEAPVARTSMADGLSPEWHRYTHLQALRRQLTDSEMAEFVELEKHLARVGPEIPHAVSEPSAAPLHAREAPEGRGGVGQEVRAAEEPAAARQAEGATAEEEVAPSDEATGLPLNPDGTVTVYHHTNQASADRIQKTGHLESKGEPDVYVTTRREADTGYGDTVVAIKIDPKRLVLDDEFPNGRRDFRVQGKRVPVVLVPAQEPVTRVPLTPPTTRESERQAPSDTAPRSPVEAFDANRARIEASLMHTEDTSVQSVPLSLQAHAVDLLSRATDAGRTARDLTPLPATSRDKALAAIQTPNTTYVVTAVEPVKRQPGVWKISVQTGTGARAVQYLRVPPAETQTAVESAEGRTSRGATLPDRAEEPAAAEAGGAVHRQVVGGPEGDAGRPARAAQHDADAHPDHVAVAEGLAGHEGFRTLGLTPRATARGITFDEPTSQRSYVGTVEDSSVFPRVEDYESLASLVADLQRIGTTSYQVDGEAYALPASRADYDALPPAHLAALADLGVVGGMVDVASGTFQINRDMLGDLTVWLEELAHIGYGRMTPEAKAERGITDTFSEEQRVREGSYPPATAYQTPVLNDSKADHALPPKMFSVRSFENPKWEKEFRASALRAGWQPKTVDEVLRMMNGIADVFRANPKALPNVGGDWSTLANNADFIKTFDVNRICKRVTQFWNTIGTIEDRIKRPLGENELLRLGQMMREDGDIAFCTFCYVEAGRRRQQEMARLFTTKEADDIAQPGLQERATYRDAYRKALGWSLNDMAEFLLSDEMEPARQAARARWAEIDRDYRAAVKAGDIKTATAIYDRVSAKSYPPDDKRPVVYSKNGTVTPLSSRFFLLPSKETAKGELADMFASYILGAKGTLRTGNGTYKHDILRMPDETIAAFNRRAGMRGLSATDFDPTMVVDVLQALADSTVKGLAWHQYTKEPYAVLGLGRTGVKFNMSVAVARDPRTGQWVDDQNNGMPLAVALALQTEFPNAGTMLVTKNLEQLEWALDADDVWMQIPHHAANWAGDETMDVSEKLRVFGLDDFSEVQHDRWENEKAHARSPKDTFGEKLLLNYWMHEARAEKPKSIPAEQEKLAVKKYLAFTKEQGIIPKFGPGTYSDNTSATPGRKPFKGYTTHPNYAQLIRDYARTDSLQVPVDVTKVDKGRIVEFLKTFVEAGAWQSKKPNPVTVKRFLRALQRPAEMDLAAGEAKATGVPLRGLDTPGKLGLKTPLRLTPITTGKTGASGAPAAGNLRDIVSQTQSDIKFAVRAKAQTETPAFKAWFGDSKVVDEDGSPLVVYHGTTAEHNFASFDTASGLGSHFSVEPAVAGVFSNIGGGRVYPVFLSLKNPLRLTDQGSWDRDAVLPQLTKVGVITPQEEEEFRSKYAGRDWWDLHPEVQRLIESKGYDGVVYLNRREVLIGQEEHIPGERWARQVGIGGRFDARPKDFIKQATDEQFLQVVPEARDAYIAFHPAQIKSAIGNRGTFASDNPDIRYAVRVKSARTGEEVFGYDYVGDAVRSWPQTKGTADQLRAHLAKTKGAMEEAEEIGLREWLKDKVTVTKAAAEEYVQTHEITLTETELGSGGDFDSGPEMDIIQAAGFDVQSDGDADDQPYLTDAEGQALELLYNDDGTVDARTTDPGRPVVEAFNRIVKRFDATRPTEYESYQAIRGGTNPREILLNVPKVPRTSAAERAKHRAELVRETEDGKTWRLIAPDHSAVSLAPRGSWTWDTRRAADADEALRSYFAEEEPVASYTAPHFSSSLNQNLLLHTRVWDYELPGGKKILVAKEIQSDWHQAGRKQGYKGDTTPRIAELDTQIQALMREIPTAEERQLNGEWRRLTQEYTRLVSGRVGLTPNAPFKDAGWKKLALRRLIAYAQQHGYDGLGWTTGEQQAELYNLAKHIDALQLVEDAGALYLTAFKGSYPVIDSRRVNEDVLPEIVGKEVAQRLLSAEPTGGNGRTSRHLRGVDLTVGGTGMVGFYDRELVNLANDLAKPLKTKVQQIAVPTEDVPGQPTGLAKVGIHEQPVPKGVEVNHNGWSIVMDDGTKWGIWSKKGDAQAALERLKADPLALSDPKAIWYLPLTPVEPSKKYAVRARRPVAEAAAAQPSPLADLTDEDLDDYFNFRRADISDEQKQHLRREVRRVVNETGRNPKEKITFEEIRNEALALHPDAVRLLKPFMEQQPAYRAVRDAARNRINVLNREIYEAQKSLIGLVGDELLAKTREIDQKEQDIKGLLDTWMRMRSEDGRNLAMHRMMSNALANQFDPAYWMGKARRAMGLPPDVDLPPDVVQKLRDILEEGRQAVEEDQHAHGEPATPTTPSTPPAGGTTAATPILPMPTGQGSTGTPPPAASPAPTAVPPAAPSRPVGRTSPTSPGQPTVTPGASPAAPQRVPSTAPTPASPRPSRQTSQRVQIAQLRLIRLVANLQKDGPLAVISAVRKAGLLTGMKTFARNITGNAAFQVLEETSRLPSVLVDMALAIGTGQRTVQGVSPLGLYRSVQEAATDGVRRAGLVMRHGAGAATNRMMGVPHELNSGIPWLDAYVNTVFRFMGAQDAVFKSYAFRRSMEEQAKLLAINTGANPVQLLLQPTPAMLATAIEAAEFATFNNSNVVASAVMGAKAAMRRHDPLVGEVGTFMIDMAAPFVNTPSNIVARMLDYTPLGAVPKATTAAVRAAIDKGMTPVQQRAFSQAIGRGMVGSALIYLGWVLAAAGLATGSDPEQPAKRNVNEAAVRLPGAIRIGDRWRQIASFSPAGNIITLGASLFRGANKPLVSEAKRVGTVAATAGKIVLEQPMLKGTSGFLDALQNPGSYGETYLASTAGSFVPTLVNDMAGAFDPYRRDARPEGLDESLLRGVNARLPGARTLLPKRLDVLGREQRQDLRVLWDPTIASIAKELTDPVTRELVRHDVGIGWPNRDPNETADEYRTRSATVGRAIEASLGRLVKMPKYTNATPEKQKDLLEDAVTDARRKVRPKAKLGVR